MMENYFQDETKIWLIFEFLRKFHNWKSIFYIRQRKILKKSYLFFALNCWKMNDGKKFSVTHSSQRFLGSLSVYFCMEFLDLYTELSITGEMHYSYFTCAFPLSSLSQFPPPFSSKFLHFVLQWLFIIRKPNFYISLFIVTIIHLFSFLIFLCVFNVFSQLIHQASRSLFFLNLHTSLE